MISLRLGRRTAPYQGVSPRTCAVLFGLALAFAVGASSAGHAATDRPTLPKVWVVSDELSGTSFATGKLFYYYWEDASGTHRWNGGAERRGYRVPWPRATSIPAGTTVRFRMDRAQWPTAGMRLIAWKDVNPENGFPTGKRLRFPCHVDAPVGRSCRLEPVYYEGRLMWDARVELPAGRGPLFIYLIPAWWDYEGASPTNIQEAGWLFHLRLG